MSGYKIIHFHCPIFLLKSIKNKLIIKIQVKYFIQKTAYTRVWIEN